MDAASSEFLSRAWGTMDPDDADHLQRLVGAWGMLADFCFSDLVLYLPIDEERLVMVAHIRPTTSQTIYHSDLIGEVRSPAQRPLVSECLSSEQMTAGEIDSAWLSSRVRVTCIPVRRKGGVIAVLAKESALTGRSHPGELERSYSEIFERFATMISAGIFPFSDEDVHLTNMPRVGDGVVLVSADRSVEYASPNATSALTRSGVGGILMGGSLADAGFESPSVRTALATGRARVDEVEQGDVVVAVRVLPLIDSGVVTGAVILLRDVSDLRRRDRLLLSKDATIREIHHRVKNNLQTISSLLRLQGRRLEEPSAKAAVEESVRRIRTIALVHDMLSREPGEDVAFLAVLRPLVRMVEEGLVSPDRPVTFVIDGDPGKISASVATSLSVALTELLQNIVEHAFPATLDTSVVPAMVTIGLLNDSTSLFVRVSDNGVGMAETPSSSSSSLGLSIVDSVVVTELGGEIVFIPGGGAPPRGGTAVEIRVPIEPSTTQLSNLTEA